MSLCFVKPNIFTYKFYRLISIHFLFKAFSLLKLVIISLILITFSFTVCWYGWEKDDYDQSWDLLKGRLQLNFGGIQRRIQGEG